MTIEQEAAVGLAYVFARDRGRKPHDAAYEWAKEHWMELLAKLDTENGQMLMRMAKVRRKIEEGQEE